MLRKNGRRILPFRLPVFRVFYSLTYTLLYLVLLVLLAITPASLIYSAISAKAYQYVFMVGGAYVLTFVLAVFIYSSRIYTNRSVLAAVGKAYVPIEDGEVSKKVRRMIVKQLERSARVAWESKPRDIEGEILAAERDGLLPLDTASVNHNDYTVGSEVTVDPSRPPWGNIQHLGWSSPSSRDDNKNPHVQFDRVIREMPHLIEARAVSIAPPDPGAKLVAGEELVNADLAVVELLKRPANAALREYLTQLSYLGLFKPPSLAERFLAKYERARFSGRPISEIDFGELMLLFAELLSGMTELSPEIITEIRRQTSSDPALEDRGMDDQSDPLHGTEPLVSISLPQLPTPVSSMMTPVTAFESRSQAATPYLTQDTESQETLHSVIQRTPSSVEAEVHRSHSVHQVEHGANDSSSLSLSSDAGSVLRHSPIRGEG